MPAPSTPMVPIIHHSPNGVPAGITTTIQTTSVDNNFELVNVISTSNSEPDSISDTQGRNRMMASSPLDESSARPPRSKSLNDLTGPMKSEHYQQTASDLESDSDSQQKSEKATAVTKRSAGSSISRGNSSDEDSGNEHLYPTLVDTSDVEGNIIQVRQFLCF